VILWAEVDGSGHLVASSGVTNVSGNAEGRFFTFNRDISKCGVSASLKEGPASVVYVERNEFPNQLITKTDVENEKVAAGGVDLVVSCSPPALRGAILRARAATQFPPQSVPSRLVPIPDRERRRSIQKTDSPAVPVSLLFDFQLPWKDAARRRRVRLAGRSSAVEP
jgi:hypothetical protein